jgi:hypothetical protein
MAFPENVAVWMTANKAKILRYAYIPQALAALVFLLLGYFMGHAHFHLIRDGIRAPGTVVDYKQESFRKFSSSVGDTAYMPVVEFMAGDRSVRFEDWKGSGVSGARNQAVTVLYDPLNPSVAMIDRPVWNWIPWAPVFGLGLFLALVAMKAWVASLRAEP